MIFQYPWAPYIPTLHIISGITQYLVFNNFSLLLGCSQGRHLTKLGTWDMPLVRVPFFTQPGPIRGPFLKESPRQCVLKHSKKLKFKISSFLAFQISSGTSLSISKVSTLRLLLFIFYFLGVNSLFTLCFYLESLSDCFIKLHVVIG